MLQGEERPDVQPLCSAAEGLSTAQSGSIYVAEVKRRLAP